MGLLKKIPLKVKIIIGVVGSSLSIIFMIIILLAPLIKLGIIDAEAEGASNDGSKYHASNKKSGFWWPIGSSDSIEEDNTLFASGNPVSTNIINNYSDTHTGVDIGPGSYTGDIYIIASKVGEVVMVKDGEETQEDLTEEEYGNYVEIKHNNGTYTVYSHLEKDSILVSEGDVVKEGQVIGKMGDSGSISGKMLHFEIRVGNNDISSSVNPTEYIKSDNTRPSTAANSFSLTETSLTKTEFVSKMETYCQNSGNSNFCNNFSSKANEVYTSSSEYGVNPELVVVTAGTEQNWGNPGGCANNNYWGIAVTNGSNCGSVFSSLSDGIRGYAETLKAYEEGGTFASAVNNRNEESEKAGCDPAGHGPAGTFEGMQSVYAYIGKYRYDPGSWGLGGCAYLNIIYGSDYCSKMPVCKDYNNCSSNTKTTVCEQNDYTAYIIEKKVSLRYDIFGL